MSSSTGVDDLMNDLQGVEFALTGFGCGSRIKFSRSNDRQTVRYVIVNKCSGING